MPILPRFVLHNSALLLILAQGISNLKTTEQPLAGTPHSRRFSPCVSQLQVLYARGIYVVGVCITLAHMYEDTVVVKMRNPTVLQDSPSLRDKLYDFIYICAECRTTSKRRAGQGGVIAGPRTKGPTFYGRVICPRGAEGVVSLGKGGVGSDRGLSPGVTSSVVGHDRRSLAALFPPVVVPILLPSSFLGVR